MTASLRGACKSYFAPSRISSSVRPAELSPKSVLGPSSERLGGEPILASQDRFVLPFEKEVVFVCWRLEAASVSASEQASSVVPR